MFRLVLLAEKTVPIAAASVAWLALLGTLRAAEPGSGKQAPAKEPTAGAKGEKQPESKKTPPSPPLPRQRDPFAVDATRAVGTGELKRLPRLELRGWLESAQGTRIALLEVEKGTTYLVREGSKLALHHQGRSWQLFVQRIEPGAVVLRLGPKGPEFWIR